jgi:hypothetical protein
MLAEMGIPFEVLHLASKQGGYVTRAQLVDIGMSTPAIDRRVATRDFTVVAPALYQVIPSSDHVDLMRGALLALPGAVVSHESAAHLLAFPQLPKLRPTVTVASRTTHVFPGVLVRRCDDLAPTHQTTVQGLRATNVVRTAFDLGGVLNIDEFDSIAEALLLGGRMKVRHLDRITSELARRGKPGAVASRSFVEARSGGPLDATVLERRGRGVLASGGLPVPVAQYPIPWDDGRRFDDAYPDFMFAIEWDSRSWHSQQAAMDADRARDREAAIHGWIVVRFTWRDVTTHPAAIAATVSSLLKSRRPAS